MTASVMIWEPDVSGHRLVYCAALLRRASELAIDARLLLPASASHDPQIGMHLAEFGDRTRDCHSLSAALNIAVQRKAPLIVPSGDDKLLYFLRHRIRVPITILIMNDPAWRPNRLSPKHVTKDIVLRTLASRSKVRLLHLCSNAPLSSVAATSVPDPVFVHSPPHVIEEGASALREEARMDDAVVWVGLVGGILAYKHPLEVAYAVRQLGGNVGFAALGPQPANIQRILSKALGELRESGVPVAVVNRRLSNEEVNCAVASLDVLVCAYDTHAPNSTAAKSHYLGTRVVGAGSRSFVNNGRRFWTTTAPCISAESLADAISVALSHEAPALSAPPTWTEFADRMIGIA